MRVKLIQAGTMAEAMRLVRSELGEEALILGHRRVANGVEITAALEPASHPATIETTAMPAASHPPETKLNSQAQRALALTYGALDWTKPVMLVGTPGAGKTLTAAKLATRLVRQGERPMVITADSDRAGAVEQLAAFTRVLQLDLIMAENPLKLSRVLANRQAGTKAIIDMAGCNPLDAAQREMLITHAVTADAALVWVIQAGLDGEDAMEMAEAFAALGARHIIPTKLDMTRRLESVLRAAEAGNFILTDAGIGSGIIDGIISLEARHLIARIDDAAAFFKTRQAAMNHATKTQAGRLVAIASGKGGVGKTWFSVTLAHALAMQAHRVLLVDGDLGLANVDIQLGMMPKLDLGHLLAGSHGADAVIMKVPKSGFDLLPGRSGVGTFSALDEPALNAVVRLLHESSANYDMLLLDCGAGVDRTAQKLVELADTVLLVITEDPTSLTDAYAVLKLLMLAREPAGLDVRVVVNMAGSPAAGLRAYETLANAANGFLRFRPKLAGVIRRDDRVKDAIRRQSLLLARTPQSIAGHDVEHIANLLRLNLPGSSKAEKLAS